MKSTLRFLDIYQQEALPSNYSDYIALIALAQPNEEFLHQLSSLQPHGKYKIAVIDPSACKVKTFPVPTLFIQSQTPSFKQIIANQPSFSVNLISPGSSSNTDLAARFISHSRTANFSWVGFQTYFTSPELLTKGQSRFFSFLRLGSYRENFKSAEPLIRNNNISLIDLSAMRYSDFPEGSIMNPNGLYAEEICQLARYIGVSSKPEACYIYGYPHNAKSSLLTARLLAQIVWHFLESLSTDQNEDPGRPDQKMIYTAKEVYIGDHDHILHFVYSNQTGRWWIKFDSEGVIYFIPCMYEEYTKALKGELPMIWLHHYQKMNQ